MLQLHFFLCILFHKYFCVLLQALAYNNKIQNLTSNQILQIRKIVLPRAVKRFFASLIATFTLSTFVKSRILWWLEIPLTFVPFSCVSSWILQILGVRKMKSDLILDNLLNASTITWVFILPLGFSPKRISLLLASLCEDTSLGTPRISTITSSWNKHDFWFNTHLLLHSIGVLWSPPLFLKFISYNYLICTAAPMALVKLLDIRGSH